MFGCISLKACESKLVLCVLLYNAVLCYSLLFGSGCHFLLLTTIVMNNIIIISNSIMNCCWIQL